MHTFKLKYIGVTLKRWRKIKLLSQEDLAWESGLDTKTISLLENDQQEPLFSTISSLAVALGMNASEFMKEIEMDAERARIREKDPHWLNVQME
ncbi:helix-turn-helix domain-containing protein [Cytobacillus praedii]|uniref:helix-turn-helix domain-containing protein n=1 Tax=Cytobacillus praedii TaxID=1742358 RepID=UPI003AF788C9